MSEDFLLKETHAEITVEWKIKEFISLPDDPNYPLHSPSFSFSGEMWYFRIEPNGDNDSDCGGWISLYLHKTGSSTKPHRVKFTIGIRRCDGSVYKSANCESEFVKVTGYGKFRLLKAFELKNSTGVLSSNGTLTIFGTIRLLEANVVDDKMYCIPQDYFSLLETGSQISVVWNVKKFLSLPKEENYFIVSPTFSISGEKLHLMLYPNGESQRGGWISLYLKRQYASTGNVQIHCSLGIRRCDGSVYRVRHITVEFIERSKTGYGPTSFLKVSELRNSNDVLAPDGSLRVFCIARSNSDRLLDARTLEAASQTPLYVACVETACQTLPSENEVPTSAVTARCSEDSVQILQQNFKDLIVSGREGDATFKVQDQEFQAHRVILSARSPVLFAMFDHDTEEKRTGIVNIDDFSAESFKDFLQFIYAGDLGVISPSNVVELYKAADKYDLQDLKNGCTSYMTVNMNSEIFCDVAPLAALHNEHKLLEIATEFFIRNCQSIILTTKWHSLMKDHTTLANELFMKIVNKK